jgi:DNA relaxase NicK
MPTIKNTQNSQKTAIDWLRFRTQSEPRGVLEALRPVFAGLPSQVSLRPLERGILGFRSASAICLGDMVIGRMDFGGESQRGWVRVDLPSKGCEWVRDWSCVSAFDTVLGAEIRRLDIALTTWDGEIGHDDVVAAYDKGMFVTGGSPPHLRQILSSNKRAGRTCYIGSREKSDKFMRCYEKGYELASKFNPNTAAQITTIDGKRIEDIYRCEVEFKSATRSIPFEAIDRSDHYFAGAYPFCAALLPDVSGDFMMRKPERSPQLDLKAALDNCRTQYGSTLYTALNAYGGDILAVFDAVVGTEHNQALLDAGVLLVDH